MTSQENAIESILMHARDQIRRSPGNEGEILCMCAASLVALAKSMTDPREWEELEAGIFESAKVICETLTREFP